jgi:hypothetical protein
MQEIGITKSQRPFRRIAIVALGWVLILLGIAGLVLPIIPGAVLILVGALMVNPQWASARRVLDNVECDFPSWRPPLGGSLLGAGVGKAFKEESGRFWSAVRSVKWLTVAVSKVPPER